MDATRTEVTSAQLEKWRDTLEFNAAYRVQQMLDAGARVDVPVGMIGERPEYPLDLALRAKREVTCLLLLNYGAPLQTDDPDLLKSAAWSGAVASTLIERGCSLDVGAPVMRDLLVTCARTGSATAVDRLLRARIEQGVVDEQGAPVHPMDAGTTPLAIAAAANWNAPVLNVLAQHRYPLTALDRDQATALHLAMAGDPIGKMPSALRETIQLLLAQGIDVDARDKDGDTPLWYAIANEQDVGALLLLQSGADPEARDNRGRNYAVRISQAESEGQITPVMAHYFQSIISAQSARRVMESMMQSARALPGHH